MHTAQHRPSAPHTPAATVGCCDEQATRCKTPLAVLSAGQADCWGVQPGQHLLGVLACQGPEQGVVVSEQLAQRAEAVYVGRQRPQLCDARWRLGLGLSCGHVC